MPMRHRVPRMTASVTCPVTKLEKALLVSFRMCMVRAPAFFGQGRQQQPPGLSQQCLLLGQHVHGEHQRQQQVDQGTQNGGGDVEGGVHHTVAIAAESP